MTNEEKQVLSKEIDRRDAETEQIAAIKAMQATLASASAQAVALARILLDPRLPKPGNAWAMLKIASRLGKWADKML